MRPAHASVLAALRARRGFHPERYARAKSALLRGYLARAGLAACVVGVSGGVDSAVTLGLLAHAARQEGSPLRRVVAALLPLTIAEGATNQPVALARGRSVAQRFGAEVVEAELGPAHGALRAAVEAGLRARGGAWSAGQLASYVRTPALYHLAALLTEQGSPALVVGTTNRDEGAYLGFYGKASDGAVDLQLVSDLHKSEVYALAAWLDVPREVRDAEPTGDTFDGRPDEAMLGASYDVVELHALVRALPAAERAALEARWSDEDRAAYARLVEPLEALHARNAHKYLVGSPAVHLDLLPRAVPGGWSDRLSASTASSPPPDPTRFVGLCALPAALTSMLVGAPLAAPRGEPVAGVREALVVRGALHANELAALRAALEAAPRVPTDAHGRPARGGAAPPPAEGSTRASVYDEPLAAALWSRLAGALPALREGYDDALVAPLARRPDDDPHAPPGVWRAVGLAPLLRVLRYGPGQRLVAHHDEGYDYGDGRRTLVSVLFALALPEGAAAATRFVSDPERHLPARERAFADGDRVAHPHEVLAAPALEPGDALLFDHRLRHDGAPFEGPGERVLLRADVVFERLAPPNEAPSTSSLVEAPAAPAEPRLRALLARDPQYASAYAALGDARRLAEAGHFDDGGPDDEPAPDPRWLATPVEKLAARLALAPPDAPLVALLTTGAMNPPHEGHLALLTQARAALEAQGAYVLGGYLSPDHDGYVRDKCGGDALPAALRVALCERAVAPHEGLHCDPWAALYAPRSLNFTAVAERLAAYLARALRSARPVHVAYVFGGDNARFALAFAARGLAVCVERPGFEREAARYAAHPALRGGRVLWSAAARDARAHASSRAVRAGALDAVPASAREAWARLREPPAAEPERALLVLRDEGPWSVEPWLAGRSAEALETARRALLAGLEAALREAFAGALAPERPRALELRWVTLEAQRAALARALGPEALERALSLDPCTPAAHALAVSRCFALALDAQREGLVARPGAPPLEAQLATLPAGPLTLLDDDRATGSTLARVRELLRGRCALDDAYTHADLAALRAEAPAGAAVDLCDARDFLVGAREAGLVVALPDGALGRAPYALPYARPAGRLGVPYTRERAFSRAVWSLNERFFAQVSPALRLRDAGAGLRALARRAGFDDDAPLEALCRWHAARLVD